MTRRKLTQLFAVVVAVLVLVGLVPGYLIRRPMPQVSGTFSVPGLVDEVTVIRDVDGVPHIYASNPHDLFYAQGYVHAQDRFWQMEVWRRTGNGTLSEVFGPATVKVDRFVRTMGWHRVAAEELLQMDDDTLAVLQAYADGVNAYIAHQGTHLALEQSLLALQGTRYTIEPWTPLNTLTWVKAMSWDLGGNLNSELERVALIQASDPALMALVKPPYDYDKPVIVPSGVTYDALEVGALREQDALLRAFRPALGSDLGSNNWVVSGALTDNGFPYVANDMHLGIQMPSIWYEVGLHCAPLGPDCPYEAVGFSFAGTPSVVAGHNGQIAWALTNVGPDVQDLYLERVNPDNPLQYEVNGQWLDMTLAVETLVVRGRLDQPDPDDPTMPYGTYDPATNTTRIELPVRLTRNGPIINDIDTRAGALAGEFGAVEVPDNLAVALRWTALTPGNTVRSFIEINKASDFEAFRDALRHFGAPAQNFIYADLDGNIGYQMPGLIPIRASGDGLLPVPGWTDDYQWTGYVPFDDLPMRYNPPEGMIVTANNAVVDEGYPYMVSREWARGYRAGRITDLLRSMSATGRLTKDDLAAIHADNAVQAWPVFQAALRELPGFSDGGYQLVYELLLGWDGQAHADSAEAAIFNVFFANLIRLTLDGELPPELWPGPESATYLMYERLLAEPAHPVWDRPDTPDVVEGRDAMLAAAIEATTVQLTQQLGNDVAAWRWGDLHTATFRNATLGSSGIGLIEALFNRGPVGVSGGSAVVNATGWDLRYDPLTGQFDYTVTSVPSERAIYDLGNWDESRTMHTTGQSGHPFHPHYDDMIDPWAQVKYHPLRWTREAVNGAAAATMVLLPSDR